MQYRRFGSTDLTTSEVGFGCARIGGVFQHSSRAEILRLLQDALAQGITFFDTADMYTQGESERLVGDAFHHQRDRVVIATKFGYRLPARKQLVSRVKPFLKPLIARLGLKPKQMGPSVHGGRVAQQDFSPEYIYTAVEASLQRLKTDYIDIYQLHDPPVELLARGDFVQPLERLRQQGKIRHWGVACQNSEDVLASLRYPSLASVQIGLSVLEQAALDAAIPRAADRGAGIIARQVFASGLLTRSLDALRLEEIDNEPEVATRKRNQLGDYAAIATRCGRSRAEMALQFALGRHDVSVVLLGISRTDQFAAAMSAVQAPKLSPEEHALLTASRRPGPLTVPVRLRVATLSVVVLALLVTGGAVAMRSSSLRALPAALVRRVTTHRQPMTWQESPPPSGVRLNVDTSHTLRPISPLIYGVAAAGADELVATGATLNRWGGNPNSRYNWENGSAWNAARDWEFRNYGTDADTRLAPSQFADRFVATNQTYGVASLVTVPSLGWVARNGNKDVASLGVPAGGGPPVGGGSSGAIPGYDPAANRAATSIQSFPRKDAPFADPPNLTDNAVFQDEWISHLVNQFGPADAEGVRFYAIDNEPDLWSFTHTDVHPVDPSYDEELSTFLDYADAIKDVDADAQILGPSISGWTAMFYSARDRGTDAFRTHADRLAHGDVPFLTWWLDQVRQHDQRIGRRTLDVLDVHFYPQAVGVYNGYTDEATNRVRLRSTRSLWDPNYVDESWIGDAVQLIPRLRGWIDEYYPGTKLAIGEWNWGADTTMNGAVAIADVLGIFGREGVDIAAYWTFPHPGSPGASAFTTYTNYDGQGHGFGDIALAATSSAPDDVQIFASRDSRSGATLLMLINQRPDVALPATVQVAGNAAEIYRLDASAPDVQHLGAQVINAGALQLVLPAESITLVRVEAH